MHSHRTKPPPVKPQTFFRYLVLLNVLALAIYGTYAARGLYADGSLYLFNVLTRNDFWIHDPPRAYAHYLTQLPVVIAVKLDVDNLNTLIRIHSAGLIATPLLLWAAAMWLQISSRLFWLLVAAFGVSYLTSGFFAVGEYNVAYAAAALCASVVARKSISPASVVLLLACAFLLMRSYEAMVFLGPLLCLTSIHRSITNERDGRLVRTGLIGAAVFFAMAFLLSAFSIVFPRDASNLVSAANVGLPLRSRHLLYLALMSGLVMVSFLSKTTDDKAVALIATVASVAYVIETNWWNAPNMNYPFRSMSGLMLFCILLALLAYAALFGYSKSDAYHDERWGTTLAAAMMCGALSVPFYVNTLGFIDWARTFENEVLARAHPVSIELTRIKSNADLYDGFNWPWSNPTLSVLLRGNAKAMILNSAAYKGWQPFDPEKIDKEPLKGFRKTTSLYP